MVSIPVKILLLFIRQICQGFKIPYICSIWELVSVWVHHGHLSNTHSLTTKCLPCAALVYKLYTLALWMIVRATKG